MPHLHIRRILYNIVSFPISPERSFLMGCYICRPRHTCTNSSPGVIAVSHPPDTFPSTSSPRSILPSNFQDYSISVKSAGLLGLFPGSPAVSVPAGNARSFCDRSLPSNANFLVFSKHRDVPADISYLYRYPLFQRTPLPSCYQVFNQSGCDPRERERSLRGH